MKSWLKMRNALTGMGVKNFKLLICFVCFLGCVRKIRKEKLSECYVAIFTQVLQFTFINQLQVLRCRGTAIKPMDARFLF